MLDKRNTCKVEMQDRRDAGKEGCKKGVIQEGAEGFVGFEPLKRTK